MDIKGHAAIVTGGGSGLGAATASELAKAGAKVALLDVNMDAANAHAQEIGGIAIKCDVSDSASAEAAIKEANAKNGDGAHPDQLRRHRQRQAHRRPRRPDAARRLRAVIKVNLIGSFNTLRLFAADLLQGRSARGGRARRRDQHRLGRGL